MVPELPTWRRRGFVPSGRVTALPNRCFTGVRITQAAASGVRPGGGAIFSALSKPADRAGQPAAATPRRCDPSQRAKRVQVCKMGSSVRCRLSCLIVARSRRASARSTRPVRDRPDPRRDRSAGSARAQLFPPPSCPEASARAPAGTPHRRTWGDWDPTVRTMPARHARRRCLVRSTHLASIAAQAATRTNASQYSAFEIFHPFKSGHSPRHVVESLLTPAQLEHESTRAARGPLPGQYPRSYSGSCGSRRPDPSRAGPRRSVAAVPR